MRVAAALLIGVVCCAEAAAQQRAKIELTPLITNLRWNEVSVTGTNVTGALGLAAGYSWSSHWHVEARAQAQRTREVFTVFGRRGGNTRSWNVERRITSRPLALAVQYMPRDDDARVSPYVGLGVRHVRAPILWYESRAIEIASDTRYIAPRVYDHRTSAEFQLGVDVRTAGRVSLRLEVDRLLRKEGVVFDPLTRVSAGVTWRIR